MHTAERSEKQKSLVSWVLPTLNFPSVNDFLGRPDFLCDCGSKWPDTWSEKMEQDGESGSGILECYPLFLALLLCDCGTQGRHFSHLAAFFFFFFPFASVVQGLLVISRVLGWK